MRCSCVCECPVGSRATLRWVVCWKFALFRVSVRRVHNVHLSTRDVGSCRVPPLPKHPRLMLAFASNPVQTSPLHVPPEPSYYRVAHPLSIISSTNRPGGSPTGAHPVGSRVSSHRSLAVAPFCPSRSPDGGIPRQDTLPLLLREDDAEVLLQGRDTLVLGGERREVNLLPKLRLTPD